MPINPNARKLIDKLIAGSPAFAQPIMKKLRAIIHKADRGIVEDWKWGANFNKNGMVCGLGAFKAHVTLTFFKGNLLKDSKKLLAPCSDGNARNRSMKFTSVDQIPEKALIDLVRQAVKLNESGVKMTARRAPIPAPPDFKKALSANKKAQGFFSSLTPSRQREYLEWITTAKRPETRAERISKTLVMCAKRQGLNDKYR
ncbi:MAG TPA: YdeI/OmpD-associated family protein [Planctomycetota bacterium]|nr:YdeI/OmpD-associated family protein [Planctomycetota bacterium]